MVFAHIGFIGMALATFIRNRQRVDGRIRIACRFYVMNAVAANARRDFIISHSQQLPVLAGSVAVVLIHRVIGIKVSHKNRVAVAFCAKSRYLGWLGLANESL